MAPTNEQASADDANASHRPRPGRARRAMDAVWEPIGHFLDRDPLTLAASIAFYSALSFAPIIVLGLWFAANLSPGSEQRLIDQIGGLLGSQVQEIALVVTRNAQGNLFDQSAAGMISLLTLLVSASTAFAQLQASINRIWDVTVQPSSAVWAWIRRRLLSLGMIAVVGFLLIVALVMSSLMSIVLTREGSGWAIANEIVTLIVFTLAFAGLFRYVPDARVPMRFALLGGALTAMLFEAGKWALGAYLASTTTADAYGAASSLILLLVWVYYSSIIVLIGAAVTRLLADRFGNGVGELEFSTARAGDT